MNKSKPLRNLLITSLLAGQASFTNAGPVADAEIMANNCEGIANIAASEIYMSGGFSSREDLMARTRLRLNNFEDSYYKYLVIAFNAAYDTLPKDPHESNSGWSELKTLAIDKARSKCKLEFLSSYKY